MCVALPRLRPATGPEALAMQYLTVAHRFARAPQGQQQGFVDVRGEASAGVGEDDPEYPGRHGQSAVDRGAGQAAERGDRLSIESDAEPSR